jgi:membrane-associated phospholipid phosphatase
VEPSTNGATRRQPRLGHLGAWFGRNAVALAVIALATVVLVWLLEEALENETMGFDLPVTDRLRDGDHVVLDYVFAAFTFVGGGTGGLALLATLTTFLVLSRRSGEAAFLALAVLGAGVLTRIFKASVDRQRPGLADARDQMLTSGHKLELLIGFAAIALLLLPTRWRVHGLVLAATFGLVFLVKETSGAAVPITEDFDSFPSGHGTAAAALAASLVVLLWSTRWRWLAVGAGVLFAVAVGLSRVYLGVHYPSDILASWSIAIGWVAVLTLVLPATFTGRSGESKPASG